MKEIIKTLYIKAKVEAIPCFNCGMDSDCSRCKFQDSIEYPPFTAEKQIVLLQFLLTKFKEFGALRFFYTGEYKLGVFDELGNYKYEGELAETLEEALASATLSVWNKLSKAEKGKLKNLLSVVNKDDVRWAML